MSRELMQARFDPDTIEEVEQYAEDTDISRSEALRRAVREGVLVLSHDGEQETEGERYANAQSGTFILVGAFVASLFGTLTALSMAGLL